MATSTEDLIVEYYGILINLVIDYSNILLRRICVPNFDAPQKITRHKLANCIDTTSFMFLHTVPHLEIPSMHNGFQVETWTESDHFDIELSVSFSVTRQFVLDLH